MTFELASFQDPALDAEYLDYLIEQESARTAGHYRRLWDYFRNPFVPAVGIAAGALNSNSRPYFQAQEAGLPARITGIQRSVAGDQPTDLQRKEVVIENDIAWRVHTMVDFLFGKPATVRSLCGDRELAEIIERVLAHMLEANGGTAFLQELALFAGIYGFADVVLRTPAGGEAVPPPVPPRPSAPPAAEASSPDAARRSGPSDNSSSAPALASQETRRGFAWTRSEPAISRAMEAAGSLQWETVEAPRVLPILADDDYRSVQYWVQKYHRHAARLEAGKRSWLRMPWSSRRQAGPAVVEVVEILGAGWWQRYEDRRLVAEGRNPLGRVPVVHVQNVALSGSYEGFSDVEPLIPLQDELNTRLSDRAHRVTYQSFKMYLGKGIDDFLERPVGPGQMWATHNLDASIEEFGSDDGSPSENIHIDDIRQAMDKVSGVTPLAAGLIRGNVGNLTSAAALRVVLSGLLARTAKKRLTFGAGLRQICEMAMEWLGLTGALPTRREDRRVEIHWPDPLPADEAERLRNAQIKAQLGLPADRVLAELGYDRQALSAGPA